MNRNRLGRLSLGLLLAPAAVLAAPPGPQDVTGRLELAGSAPEGAVLFLSARADGAAKGPPTWVLRMSADAFPGPMPVIRPRFYRRACAFRW